MGHDGITKTHANIRPSVSRCILDFHKGHQGMLSIPFQGLVAMDFCSVVIVHSNMNYMQFHKPRAMVLPHLYQRIAGTEGTFYKQPNYQSTTSGFKPCKQSAQPWKRETHSREFNHLRETSISCRCRRHECYLPSHGSTGRKRGRPQLLSRRGLCPHWPQFSNFAVLARKKERMNK